MYHTRQVYYQELTNHQAGGNLGEGILPVFLKSPLNISVLSRPDSKSTFDSHIKVIKSTYEPAELRKAFEGQDAVISLVGSLAITTQKDIIDAAADAGVKWFIPSEFGSNTTDPELVAQVPFFKDKIAAVNHLRTKESSGLSWTALITGAFFDWAFGVNLIDIDVAKREATIWNGGDVKWSGTNLATIGKALVNLLSNLETLEKSKNRYVAIQSFLTSQNEIVATLEKITGAEFKVVAEKNAEDEAVEAKKRLAAGDHSAFKGVLLAPLFGGGYGNHEKKPGLSNDLLLPGHEESLEETLREVVKKLGQ